MWFGRLQALFVIDDVTWGNAVRLPLTYVTLLCVGYVLIYGVFAAYCAPRRIQPGYVRPGGTFRREAVLATLTFVVGTCFAMGTARLAWNGVIRIDVGPASAASVLGEMLVYFVLVDLYFYATHRFLHLPFMYRHVHGWHHRSVAPTLLTAFAIHPVEAILNTAFLPIFLYTTELHFIAIVLVSIHAPINSMLLHSGHELFPRWWYTRRATSWYASAIFHDEHHAGVVHNFGVLTTVWDRVFGTIQPGFVERVLALHVTRDEPPPASVLPARSNG